MNKDSSDIEVNVKTTVEGLPTEKEKDYVPISELEVLVRKARNEGVRKGVLWTTIGVSVILFDLFINDVIVFNTSFDALLPWVAP